MQILAGLTLVVIGVFMGWASLFFSMNALRIVPGWHEKREAVDYVVAGFMAVIFSGIGILAASFGVMLIRTGVV